VSVPALVAELNTTVLGSIQQSFQHLVELREYLFVVAIVATRFLALLAS